MAPILFEARSLNFVGHLPILCPFFKKCFFFQNYASIKIYGNKAYLFTKNTYTVR